MKTTDIILTAFETALGNEYTIIKSFDAQENLDLNGVIAINISNFQRLQHGTENDYKIRVNLNGMTLADEDKDKSLINAMFNYAMYKFQDITFDNLAGKVLANSNLQSDGTANTFSVSVDLFVCDCCFN